MMPSYPRRTSTLHATLLAQPGTRYEAEGWQTYQGAWHGAVRYADGPLLVTIQGPPEALRELAAALTSAADQADQHVTDPDPEPAPAAEGVSA